MQQQERCENCSRAIADHRYYLPRHPINIALGQPKDITLCPECYETRESDYELRLDPFETLDFVRDFFGSTP